MSHLPYTPISRFYSQKFGEKAYKIPVAVAEDCPNRRGLKGMQTCIFCDEWGSAADKESHKLELEQQILKIKSQLVQKYRAKKFLVYFQAYTNTFARLQTLNEQYEVALAHPDVVGLVIGTRPDCLSKAVMDLWQELSKRTALFVEFGAQSFFDDQLEFLRRGHTAQQTIDAVFKVRACVPEANVGLHLMFGLPGESDESIRHTALLCNLLPIDNVKLHNLHVLKNTPLEDLYRKGEFVPIDFNSYARRVMIFLQHLNPETAVHRLGAVASRWDELVAPEWTRYKMAIFQDTVNYMLNNGAHQGQFFERGHPRPSLLTSLSY